MTKNTTFMWREAPEITGDKIYRFQTNNSEINRRMRRRKDFTLSSYGMNIKMWGYRTKKYSLKDAKKTLKRITRQNIDFDPFHDMYFSYCIAENSGMENFRKVA